MYLAIFGDVHGSLDDMFFYCVQWEKMSGEKITAILQTGDLGVFPHEEALDKATRKHARKDPRELGCKSYILGKKEASHLTIFVRGNHEDFDFLASHENSFIDPFRKLYYLASGNIFFLESEDHKITVSGLGGIFYKGDNPEKKKRNLGRKYFSDEECERLLSLKPQKIDILLFHEAPRGYGLENNPNTGADEVTLIIEHLQPRFAFFGHYSHPPQPFYIGRTLCIGMNNPQAKRLPGRDGGMGILNTRNWKFEFVPEETVF